MTEETFLHQYIVPTWVTEIYRLAGFTHFDNTVELTKAFWKRKKEKNYNPRKSRRTKEYILNTLRGFFYTRLNEASNKSSKASSPLPFKTFPSWLQKRIKQDPSYIPPTKNRFLLSRSLTSSPMSKIAVYCDLKMLSSDPMLLNFEYIDKNIVEVENAKKKKEMVISCSCKGPCSSTCECIKFQKAIADNKEDVKCLGSGIVLDYHSYGDYEASSITSVMVMCGELCGCSPDCPNRLENIVVNHQFEIFRRNEELGFGIRTLNSIEPDQFIVEFNGEVKRAHDFFDNPRRRAYSFELCGTDAYEHLINKMITKRLPGHRNIRKRLEWWKLLEEEDLIEDEAYHDVLRDDDRGRHLNRPLWYIDPYSKGSAARFTSHGCTQNAIVMRVISNYLHPAFHRLFYKACMPIPAGTEILINYGKSYFNEFLKHQCKCGTLFCQDNLVAQGFLRKLTMNQQVNILYYYYQELENWLIKIDSISERVLNEKIQQEVTGDDDIVYLERFNPLPESFKKLKYNIESKKTYMEGRKSSVKVHSQIKNKPLIKATESTNENVSSSRRKRQRHQSRNVPAKTTKKTEP